MRYPPRSTATGVPGDRVVYDRLGVDVQADVRERDRAAATADRTQRVLICTTLYAFREDVGGSGDASYTTRMAVPTAAATFGSVTTPGYRATRPGAAIRGDLKSNDARTGGSATLILRVTDGSGVSTDYPFTDAILDGTAHPEGNYTRSAGASMALAFGDGFPYAAGDELTVRILTAGTFAPTTADMSAYVVIAELETLP